MVWLETVHARTRGGLTVRNAGLGWEGHGSSTCYLLGSVLLSPSALSHSWGPDWTAMDKIKALKGTGCRGEGNSHPITYTRRMCFFLHTFKDVKRNASAVHHGLFQSCFLSVSRALHFPYQLWTKHTTVHTDAVRKHTYYFVHCNRTEFLSVHIEIDLCVLETGSLWHNRYLQVVSQVNKISCEDITLQCQFTKLSYFWTSAYRFCFLEMDST